MIPVVFTIAGIDGNEAMCVNVGMQPTALLLMAGSVPSELDGSRFRFAGKKRRGPRLSIALALVLAGCVPPGFAEDPQSPTEPLKAKEVRRAETEARTAPDHLRLAAYYRSKAAQAQVNLSEAEVQMKSWAAMADRTKIPNPYWSARARAGNYREVLKKMTKLAAVHERIAASLESEGKAVR